jgi:hypothetical protein
VIKTEKMKKYRYIIHHHTTIKKGIPPIPSKIGGKTSKIGGKC